jgi:guanylate kinase
MLPSLLQGAGTVRKPLTGVVSAFLDAESAVQLLACLVSRKSESMQQMLTRVTPAAGSQVRH